MLRRGDRVGRYRVEGPLGRGAMGEVYVAVDEELRRPIALKTVRAAGDRRLLREARAAAILTHPNAVVVYDVGERGDLTFVAMELVQGTSLRAKVRDATVRLDTKLEWMCAVGRVLAEAHRLGLVHRDIKPANVMIRHDGIVKVLDFGAVKRMSEESKALTADGLVLGTPKYMAPEAFEGIVAPAIDQFAWGMMTYALIAGGPLPFMPPEGTTRYEWTLRSEPVALQSRVPSIPDSLAEVVMRAVAKSPSERFRDMTEATDALSRCLEDARRVIPS
jgi:eukaryotic-like serine/threonine-protein kinase